MYIIYKIECNVNNKIYIGVTNQSLDKRWYQHKYLASTGKGSYFHKAIRKYGNENFTITHIFTGFVDRNIMEQEFIREYHSFGNGYNSTEGGEDFTSSEYQRQLQLTRVQQGSHPFIGGTIQRESSKNRWDNDTNPIKGLNSKRISDGTHNFLGDNNPQKLISALHQHHNQKKPWCNTNTKGDSLVAWSIADKLYVWYSNYHHKPRGGSYKAMAKAFDLKCSLQKMYYEYFDKGWIPLDDPSWVEKFYH